MMIKQNILVAGAILLLISCAGSKGDGQVSIKDRFNIGMESLENEKYLKAQTDFKNVLLRGTGSDLGDDAQYYLGEAFFRNKEYLLAIAEYEKLTRRMGFSPFVEDARFKICEAYTIESPEYYHDQEYTEKALERYQEFLDDYPNSKFIDEVLSSIGSLREKLGRKLYETGVLYIKLEEYESAKMTFQLVIDQYYDTSIINYAYQGMVRSLAKNREIEDAIALLNQNEIDLIGSGLYNDAKEAIDDMEKKIAKEQK